MKTELTKEQEKEATALLVSAQKKVKSPGDVTDEELLKLTMPQLNAYIKQQTKGMKVHKKFKFGQQLIKRIENAKKDQKQ